MAPYKDLYVLTLFSLVLLLYLALKTKQTQQRQSFSEQHETQLAEVDGCLSLS